MYAVIESGGKQYRVAPGDKIKVNSIAAGVGSTVEFNGTLAVGDPGQALKTGDAAGGAKVTATVSKQGRGPKIVVFKFKRKKQYKRTIGHRQNYTELSISDVTA
jgi:large subunit ribosomal protein L21